MAVSQVSTEFFTPSPQADLQLVRHASSSEVLPSSHCSGGSTTRLPQLALASPPPLPPLPPLPTAPPLPPLPARPPVPVAPPVLLESGWFRGGGAPSSSEHPM